MTVFIGYLWTEGVSANKKLGFQTKTDTSGRGLRVVDLVEIRDNKNAQLVGRKLFRLVERVCRVEPIDP